MTTKTLTLGKKPSLKGIGVSSWAKELLEKTTYSKKKEVLNLAILTPADLGFTIYPTIKEFYARAKEKGYELCPAEVGPQLAGTVEETGWLFIAMEPITDSDGRPGVFAVERSGGGEQWLGAGWALPDGQWYLGSRVVFRLRKPLDSDTSTSVSALGNSEPLPSDIAARLEAVEAILKYHNLTSPTVS